MADQLCITSYNSTGTGLGTLEYMETLLLFSDILCVQEHFLLDSKDRKHSNTTKLRNKFKNHDMFIVPASKGNNQVSRGRGKGGLATIWNKSLTKYVKKIKCENYRIQATEFNLPQGPIVLINTYFPCDPRTSNFDDTELMTTLTTIQNIITQAGPAIIWLAGDLNCHFNRNTRFTNLVESFFLDLGLSLLWENLEDLNISDGVDYTYMNSQNGIEHFSTIDHFACPRRAFSSVKEAGVIHADQNLSNHSAIFVRISVGELDTKSEKVASVKRVKWSTATEESKSAYKQQLAAQLLSLPVPECAVCDQVHCPDHKEDIETYTIEVLEAIENAAKNTLPISTIGESKSKRKKTTPGWSEFVKPYLEESKFWKNLWVSAGKPTTGDLFNVMKNSKLQYKYAVRRLKRAGESIQNNKFVDSIVNGGVNIYEEIKKFRGTGMSCSSRIDEEVGSTNIADHFAGIYSELYNRVEHGADIQVLSNDIEKSVRQDSMDQVNRINEKVVMQALKQMKGNKNDALFMFQSDCLINGPPELVTNLTYLLRSFVSHGFVPHFILLCTLIPLVKDNLGDSTSSDNYRAIASGSLLLKLLDLVILILEGSKLKCDSLQFGFQPESGTIICTWTASAIIDFFNKKGTVVYGAAMDLSKAFDMVDWSELFSILKNREVAPVFLRVILYIYRYQLCDVKWNSSYSYRFPIKNGVRQGAVSSPLLFSVYINDLFGILRESGLGCQIGGLYVGCLGYADDLLLLSASRSGLQCMVSVAEKFMKEKNLKFSTSENPMKSKTKCIIFSKKSKDQNEVAPVLLNGDPLPWVKQVKHLGNLMQCDNSMRDDCTWKRGKFIGRINSLLQEFSFCDPSVKLRIFNIYATSFYGSGLWDLASKEVDKIYKSWNVAVRMAFGVPPMTHRYLVEHISKVPHVKTMLASRYANFVNILLRSCKPEVALLASLSFEDNRTVMGKTVSRLKKEIIPYEISARNIKKKLRYFPVPAEEEWRLPVLDELVAVEAGNSIMTEDFSKEDIKSMISALCTA